MQKPPVRARMCAPTHWHAVCWPRAPYDSLHPTTSYTTLKGPEAQHLMGYMQWLPVILGYSGSGCKSALHCLHPVGFVIADTSTHLPLWAEVLFLFEQSESSDRLLATQTTTCNTRVVWWEKHLMVTCLLAGEDVPVFDFFLGAGQTPNVQMRVLLFLDCQKQGGVPPVCFYE